MWRMNNTVRRIKHVNDNNQIESFVDGKKKKVKIT